MIVIIWYIFYFVFILKIKLKKGWIVEMEEIDYYKGNFLDFVLFGE